MEYSSPFVSTTLAVCVFGASVTVSIESGSFSICAMNSLYVGGSSFSPGLISR